jgi:iron(III) transport system substrate-binding protein
MLMLMLMLLAVKASANETKAANDAKTVNVYSYRQPFLVEPLFEKFTRQTGIKVKVIFAQKGLIERVALEGRRSPADVILTVDAGRLVEAGARIARPVISDILQQHIPAAFRDRENRWFGLTLRARVAFVSNRVTDIDELNYSELAEPQWRGRICSRTGQHPYNIGMFAAYLHHHGVDATRDWLAGLKANLARRPSGNDRAQVRAVYAGECDIAIGNTYYMGKMQNNTESPEQQAWADAVRLIFPNRQTTGTHVNISGMMMAQHAPHPGAAQKLMEFLISPEAQQIYADMNYEYPVRAGINPSPQTAAWGALNPDLTPMAEIAKLHRQASRLVDEVGFDQ